VLLILRYLLVSIRSQIDLELLKVLQEDFSNNKKVILNEHLCLAKLDRLSYTMCVRPQNRLHHLQCRKLQQVSGPASLGLKVFLSQHYRLG